MANLLPFREREATPGYALEAYDEILRLRGRVPSTTGVLLRTPRLAIAFAQMKRILDAGETTVPLKYVELAICVAARAADDADVWGSHYLKATALGVSSSVLEAIEHRSGVEALEDGDEALVVEFARELLDKPRLPETTYERIAHRFGERGAVELAATLGVYLLTVCVNRLADLEPPSGRPVLQLSSEA